MGIFVLGQLQVNATSTRTVTDMTDIPDNAEVAVFGGGCFWCTEAVFARIPGVLRVESGYTGGHVDNPTYKQVVTGDTGHAEVVKITYDPDKVSYRQLLLTHFASHDPTTLNRQGADVGTQYRSAIFYENEAQRETAEAVKAELEKEKVFGDPIVTEITGASMFYPAEDYHQDYFENNRSAGYCQFVIAPKLRKLGLE